MEGLARASLLFRTALTVAADGLADDILDATSTKEVMGKSVRADQKNQKSTYPKVLGLEKSRAYAAELIADAHRQLRGFGAKAEPLRAIADFFLTRYLPCTNQYPSWSTVAFLPEEFATNPKVVIILALFCFLIALTPLSLIREKLALIMGKKEQR